MSFFKDINKKYALFFLFLATFMIMRFDVIISNESKNNLNPLGIETVIYPNEAIAQNACTFPCKRGLDSCGGSPNCTQKWVCASGCGACDMEWVKYTEGSTSGTCDNSGIIVN